MRAPYSKEQEAREGGISHHCKSICSPIPVSNYIYYIFSQERIRTATRVYLITVSPFAVQYLLVTTFIIYLVKSV